MNNIWKPIETAPKDGTHIIVIDGVGGVHGAYWTRYVGKESWFTYTTHGWLPSACGWIDMPEKKKNN
jgi:hypothetical protein